MHIVATNVLTHLEDPCNGVDIVSIRVKVEVHLVLLNLLHDLLDEAHLAWHSINSLSLQTSRVDLKDCALYRQSTGVGRSA